MKKSVKNVLKIIIGLLLSLMLLYLTFRKVDLNTLIEKIKNANVFLIIFAALIHMASYFIIGLRWRILLGKGMGVLRLSIAVMTGYLFNLIFFRLGDALKCFLVKDKYEVSHAAASVVTEKIIDILVVIGFSFIPLFFLKNVPLSIKKLLFIPLIGFVAVVIIVFLSFAIKPIEKLIIKFLNKLPFKNVLTKFYLGFKEKIIEISKRPKAIITSVLLTLFLWFIYLIFFTLTVRALGLNLHLGKMCFILGVTTFGMNIPVGVGFIGTFHYAFYISATAVGGDPGIAQAAGIVLHLSKVFGHIVMGFTGLSFQKLPELRHTVTQIKNGKSKSEQLPAKE